MFISSFGVGITFPRLAGSQPGTQRARERKKQGSKIVLTVYFVGPVDAVRPGPAVQGLNFANEEGLNSRTLAAAFLARVLREGFTFRVVINLTGCPDENH
jgi:hypothetical protein